MRRAMSLFAVLIIALMLVGVSYALWSKTLNVSGTAEMGYVKAGFTTQLTCGDNEAYMREPKDVGTTTATPIDLDGDGIYDKIGVLINNAYPGYEGFVSFVVKNYGSVPIKCKINMVSIPSSSEVSIWFTNLEGERIDPGAENTAMVKFAVNQPAAQNHAYNFEIYIVAMQWNE